MDRPDRTYIGTVVAAARRQLIVFCLLCLPLEISSVHFTNVSHAWAESPSQSQTVPPVEEESPSSQPPQKQAQEKAQITPQDGQDQSTQEPQQGASPQLPPPEQKQSVPAVPPAEGGEKKPGLPPSGGLQQTPEPSVNTEEQEKETTLVDVLHGEISRTIQGTATWMDSFFGNRRYESELNQSYVRFSYNLFLEEDSGPLRKPDMQLRLVLPQLREKTRLEISGAPKEDPGFSAIQSADTRDQVTTPDQGNVTTAVHYQVRETAQQNFTVRAGLKFHSGGPAVVLGPRFRVLFPLDDWNLRLVEELTWYSQTGWQSRSTIDLERPLPRSLFFRATNEWFWVSHVNGYLYAINFHLGQPLSLRRALEYEWINIFQTRPVNELTEVVLRIRYRQKIWRNWLYFEVTPQCRFPRDRGFETTPGILFRFEMFLGSYR